jgi:hypothetical protein
MASKAVAQNFLEYAEVTRLKGKDFDRLLCDLDANRKPL